MTQVHLAFCHLNSNLADILDTQFPGVHIVRIQEDHYPENGAFAQSIVQTQGPVILLITDNFMKSDAAMSGALEMVLTLMRQNRLMVIVANGIRVDNGETVSVETHIDRVVNAIQYMNFWQQEYLALSDRYNHADDQSRDALFSRQKEVHEIADQAGELISALRDADPHKWEHLSASGFSEINKFIGLPISAQMQEPEIESTPVVPPPDPEIQPVSGPVTFRPAEPPVVESVIIPDTPGFEFDPHLHLIHSDPHDQESTHSTADGHYREQEIEETIQDAWAWIARGNRELGLEVFKVAMEQYPHHEHLREEYEKALSDEPDADTGDLEQEANAYEAAGDSAFNDGDYLMAKYCWDRAAETNPGMNGIWRKLGLLTSDQLSGYAETSIIYLKKAHEQNPEDQEVIERLNDLGIATAQAPPPVQEEAIAAITVEEHPAPEIVEPLPVTTIEPSPVVIEVPEIAEPNIIATEAPIETTIRPALRNEIVLITGATSGIGKATAVEFARHGYRIIITGRRSERLFDLRNMLESQFGVEVLPLVFDVREQKAVEAILTHLPESWQEIDILINNAGLAKGLAPIHEGNLEHWETMIDTNIKGLLYVTQIISRGMVARRRGHIVNISSTAGKEAYPNGNVYCATKFAVEALTKSLRFDLHKYGIRVSQVSPGHVEETEFAINRFDGDADKARIYDDFQPLKASDIAETIWFIASRPAHVNVQDVYIMATQQASAMVVDRSGR